MGAFRGGLTFPAMFLGAAGAPASTDVSMTFLADGVGHSSHITPPG